MKIKVEQVINARAVLMKMNNEPVPISVAYKLDKIIQEINVVLRAFEKQRLILLDKYANKDKKTGKYSFSQKTDKENEATENFSIQITAVLDEEIEFSGSPIAIADLEGINITSADVNLINWIIK